MKQKAKIIFLISAILFVISMIGFCLSNWYIEFDTTQMPTEIEYGEEMPLPKAYIKGRWLFKTGKEVPIMVEYAPQTQKVGVGYGLYHAKLAFYQNTCRHDFSIVDNTPPILELYRCEDHLTDPDIGYQEEGYFAFDEHDGDLTKMVEISRNGDLITYTVKDSSGNKAVAQREIKYMDKVKPVISLNGDSSVVLYQNDNYIENGATAVDDIDGDLTGEIEIISNVDTKTVGEYTVKYIVSDLSGNKTEVTRSITVLERKKTDKVIYLTFDDGPGPHTERLLDILDEYNVKATFFVVSNSNYNYLIKEIVDRGHQIAIHSETHKYSYIYKNTDNYFKDLEAMKKIIFDISGVETNIIRFPGGSSNTVSKSYCLGIMSTLSKMVRERGYQYFDWNVTSGDAGETESKDQVVKNVISGVKRNKISVVLQHDIKDFSVDAVPEIIEWAFENGYCFDTLTEAGPIVHHAIGN